MNLLQRSICLFGIAVAFAASAQERSALPDPRTALRGAELVEALKNGGLTLYFRHGGTDHSQLDAILATAPAPGKLRVIASHGNPLPALSPAGSPGDAGSAPTRSGPN